VRNQWQNPPQLSTTAALDSTSGAAKGIKQQ
jgi:hypothetical protein